MAQCCRTLLCQAHPTAVEKRHIPLRRRSAGRHQLFYLGTTPMTRRSEEHTSELQSLMRISYAVFCLKKKKTSPTTKNIKYNRTNTADIYINQPPLQSTHKHSLI